MNPIRTYMSPIHGYMHPKHVNMHPNTKYMNPRANYMAESHKNFIYKPGIDHRLRIYGFQSYILETSVE